MPKLSNYFQSKIPSSIRLAQMQFEERKDTDQVEAINVAIGNVSLPMHPAMQKRLNSLSDIKFEKGIVKYSSTKGFEETNQAFLKLIQASGFSTEGLYSQITDGSSSAMMLTLLGVSGSVQNKERPILVIDPTYTNYKSMAARLRTPIVSITRRLQEDGKFELPNIGSIEKTIKEEKPNALLIIPYDNPTGQFMDQKLINKLAQLCVKYNMWLISDEAYRETYYGEKEMSSIWEATEEKVPGIQGRRISLDSSSKLCNACGLRIGALITDNKEFHKKAINEFTTNLCAPVVAQYIFGALAHLSKEELRAWFKQQRNYYRPILKNLFKGFQEQLPEAIVAKPESSIYSVIDVRNIVKKNFDALDFVMFCAKKGKVKVENKPTTLLVSPLANFYNTEQGKKQGRTQMRIACVESPKKMKKVPLLFSKLLKQYKK